MSKTYNASKDSGMVEVLEGIGYSKKEIRGLTVTEIKDEDGTQWLVKNAMGEIVYECDDNNGRLSEEEWEKLTGEKE